MSAPAAGRSLLVTGASGLVGRQVIARLAREPGALDTLVAADLRPPPEQERVDGVYYVTADVRDPTLGKLLEQHAVDTVVHLAAIVTPGPGSSRALEYEVDVLGTRNVVEACLQNGVGRFVYTSSGAAYGFHANNPVPLREIDPLRGNEAFAYAWHKRLVEEELARHRREHPALAQLIFRPGTILGERVDSPITALFERWLVVGVTGSDAPFVFIWDEDVADCIVRGVHERRAGIYNLAGDGSVALPEIARRLGRPYLPLSPALLAGALGALHAMRLSARGREQVDFLRYRPVLSNEKLKSEFDFTPRYTSDECFDHYRQLRFGS